MDSLNKAQGVDDVVVSFCGHSRVSNYDEIHEWLINVISQLIDEGATLFYSGGYGQFDHMVAGILKELKNTHPQLESVLVLAYLNREVDVSLYDDTTYPPIENVPVRYAILKRNHWMVEQADIVVAYVTHNWGGAAQMLEYAERKKKKLVRFGNFQDSPLP